MDDEIERFEASNNDGSYKTTIIIYEEIIKKKSIGNSFVFMPGPRIAKTIDGTECCIINSDLFEIPGVGVVHRC